MREPTMIAARGIVACPVIWSAVATMSVNAPPAALVWNAPRVAPAWWRSSSQPAAAAIASRGIEARLRRPAASRRAPSASRAARDGGVPSPRLAGTVLPVSAWRPSVQTTSSAPSAEKMICATPCSPSRVVASMIGRKE